LTHICTAIHGVWRNIARYRIGTISGKREEDEFITVAISSLLNIRVLVI